MAALSQSLLDRGKMGLIVLRPDRRIDACMGQIVDWLSPGDDAVRVIPFLVGLDDTLDEIVAGREASFTLPRVGWSVGGRSDQVLSLEIMQSDAQGHLQILVRDETEISRLEQDVLQQRNELTLANDALAEAKERAEALLQEKASFLANISHDLKTPLQVILGNAEILRDDLPKEERDGFLQDVLDNSNFLLALITDLLDASTLDANKLKLTEERIDVRALLELVISTASHIPGGKNRNFELTIDQEDQIILADPMRLRRLLLNVVGNAVKFTEDDGQILLKAGRAQEGCFLVEVEDDGCGIDPELLIRVFEPFTMGPSSDGTGLGLHIAQGLAELHDGSLSISSVPGEGTKVGLRLPRSRLIDATA